MKEKVISISIIFVILTNFALPTKSQIKIIAGVEGGTYNLIAKDIQSITTVPVEVVPSGGSIDNYNRLLNDTNIAISFLQYDVLLYKKMLQSEETKQIKILVPLFTEEIHLIASVESGITSLKDLQGKKVAIGSPSQGTNITAKLIQFQTQIDWKPVEIDFSDAFVSLLTGAIDAFFFVGGAPVEKFQKFSLEMGEIFRMIPVVDDRLDHAYKKVIIPAGLYPWVNQDIQTYAVQAVLGANISTEASPACEMLTQLLTDLRKNVYSLQRTGHLKWRQVTFNYDNINWSKHNCAKSVFEQ